jgi:recombinational DNA repair ATPase RecF
VIARDGRELRAFGSQGEQRLALLALLLAERDALAAERSRPPLMLLDDVMSELDLARRELLASELRRRRPERGHRNRARARARLGRRRRRRIEVP